MRKWQAIVALVVAGVGAAGCATPCASTGWRFEVGRPSVFTSPGLVQQQSGNIAVSPLGTTLPPVVGDLAAATVSGALKASTGPHILGKTRTADECTLEDVCLMLRRIESRLAQQAPPTRPMPLGPPKMQE